MEHTATGEPAEPSSAGFDAGGPAGGLGSPGAMLTETETAVPHGKLASYNDQLYAVPDGFHLHPKLGSSFQKRRSVFDSEAGQVDWAHAEALALASILADGGPIRLTGQDTARGAFSQRHLVLHDYENGSIRTPLQALREARASFEVWDSPLSETATMGFEFGYDLAAPEALVLWEAQYGDFVNAAQVIVDQFVASARSKWGQQPKLVLLLPHGYEGQGPDHSSAHLERFLQLTAEDNLRVANCSTAAQYFHILRRQAQLLAQDPRPLVLLTPKSMLRHPLASSLASELSSGRFQAVIDDASAQREEVRRLILCSGKVYVDLAATGRLPAKGLAVARVEELYPFPAAALAEVIAGYPRLREVVWLQEEPRDMGAWTFVAPRLRDIPDGGGPVLQYIGRTRRAGAAEGSHEWHMREQQRIVDAAFDLDSAMSVDEAGTSRNGRLPRRSRREARHAS